MRLGHDPFLTPALLDGEARSPEQLKAALAGIGDRGLREAQDYLWSVGVQTGVRPKLAAGDSVEFEQPDGSRRAGRVHTVNTSDCIVQIDTGSFAIVPIAKLAPLGAEERRAQKQTLIRGALKTYNKPELHETRSLAPLGTSGLEYACTLEYRAGLFPTSDDLADYVNTRYPGARIVDGDDRYPGRLGLVLAFGNEGQARFALEASRRGQVSAPAEAPSTRENATGIGKEEIEGTGKMEPNPLVTAAKAHLARLNEQSKFTFVASSLEETAERVFLNYEVWQGDRPLFVRANRLQTVLSEDAVPAVGTIVAEMGKDTPYASGTGPDSAHFDEPNTYETGNYAVHADLELEGSPPPIGDLSARDFQRMKDHYDSTTSGQESEEAKAKRRRLERQKPRPKVEPLTEQTPLPVAAEADGDQRETIGGPGLDVVAVDDAAKDYYEDYFGEYGVKLTEDQALHQVAMVHAAWHEAGRGVPTARELTTLLTVLNTQEMTRTALANGFVESLLHSKQTDPSASNLLDKIVTNFVARTPSALDAVSPTAFAQLLSGAVSALERENPAALEKLRLKLAPETEPVDTTGQPGLWDRAKRKVKETFSGTERAMGEIDRAQAVPGAPPAAPAAAPAAAPPPAATAGTVQLDPSSKVFDVNGKPAKISQPTDARVLKQENGVTVVRTDDGQVLRLAQREPSPAPYAGRLPQAYGNLHFSMQGIERDGDYVIMTIVWDADGTADMSPANLAHNLKTYAMQRAGEKEAIDIGYIGKPTILSLDPDVGMAEVRVRASDAKAFPPTMISREDDTYEPAVR